MGRRLILVVTLVIIVVALVCLSAYVLARPTATASWETQTQRVLSTELAVIVETKNVQNQVASETALAQSGIDTQIAAQAISVSQTEQARPTETMIPSPTNSPSDCNATLKNKSPVYLVPSTGWISTYLAKKGEKVQIFGRLGDKGWYPVKSNSFIGWLPESALDFEDACPKEDTLFHLVSLVNQQSFIKPGQNVITEDTFVSNTYGWKDELSSLYPRQLDEKQNKDYQLIVDAYSKKKSIFSDRLLNISNPSVALSVLRSNASNDSYISIVFESVSNPNTSFEVRVLGGNCTIQVFENQAKITDQPVDGMSSACSSTTAENHLEFSVNGAEVFASVNGQGPYRIALSQDYGVGNLSFAADRTNIKIGFLIVTIP